MEDTPQHIAVFGSWREPKDQILNECIQGSNRHFSHNLTKLEFETACRQLGLEIARNGNVLLVASDSDSTIDYHIVQGIIEGQTSLEGVTRSIQVIRSRAKRSSKDKKDCSEIYARPIAKYGQLFTETIVTLDADVWEDVHDYMAGQADKILVIGGGKSSYRIAVKVLADGKPIVPVGSFGGAGREIIEMLENVRDQRNFPRYEYRTLLKGELGNGSV